MSTFTAEQIERLKQDSAGKVIAELEHVEDGDYFVLHFSDGTETSVRFMAQLYMEGKA